MRYKLQTKIMKIKQAFLSLLFSLSFIPIWGLTLLDISTSNQISIFIGLIYTPISVFIIKDINFLKDFKYLTGTLFLGPLFYLIANIVVKGITFDFITGPIAWAFLTFLGGLFFIKQLNFKTLFIVCFSAYFFSYHVNPTFTNIWQSKQLPENEINKKDINIEKKLYTYSFENFKKDTLNLKPEKTFTLVETWNEGCAPCIAAMKDLQDFIDDSLSSKVAHYYLYENGANNTFVSRKIYNFKYIKDKSKILADVGNKFITDSKMASFPYFLLFDKEGYLVDYFKGYDGRHKDYFINKLKKMTSTQ